MMIATSTGTLLLLLAVGIIHQTMAWSRRIDIRTSSLRTHQQLADQWRSDCRHADRFLRVSDQEATFQSQDGHDVVYQSLPGEVIRKEFPPQSSSEKPIRSERYRIDQACRIRFEQVDAPKRARLMVCRDLQDSGSLKIELSIDGVLGRWSRLGGNDD